MRTYLIALMSVICLLSFITTPANAKKTNDMHFKELTVDDSDPYAGNGNGKLDPGEGVHPGHRVKLVLRINFDKTIDRFVFEWKISRNCGDVLRFYDGHSNTRIGSCKYSKVSISEKVHKGKNYFYTFYVSVDPDLTERKKIEMRFNDQAYRIDRKWYDDDDDDERFSSSRYPYTPPEPPECTPPSPVVIEPLETGDKNGDLTLFFTNSANTDRYNIYRKKGSGSFVKIASVTTNKYKDDYGEGCFSWMVRPENDYGEAENSNTVSVCYSEPDAPGEIKGFSVSPSTYEIGDVLRFSCDPQEEADYYEFEAYILQAGQWVFDGSDKLTDSFSDYQTHTGEEQWKCRVRVVNSTGFSSWSSFVYAYLLTEDPTDEDPVDNDPVENNPEDDSQTSSDNKAPEIIDQIVLTPEFVGGIASFDIYVHEPEDDPVTVEWFLNGESKQKDSLVVGDYYSSFSFTTEFAGQHDLRVVVSDNSGNRDFSEHSFNTVYPPIADTRFFEIRDYSGVDLFYYNNSVYDRVTFGKVINSLYANKTITYEEIPGSRRRFQISVITEDELTAMQLAGEFILGFTDRCSEESGYFCTTINIGSSSIPLIEEVQEVASVAVNLLCFIAEGTSYVFTGDEKYVDKMTFSLTNVGFSAVSFFIPFVVDPQGGKALFKGGKKIAKDLKKVEHLKDPVTLRKFVTNKYSSFLSTTTLNKVDNLLATSATMTAKKNVNFMDKVVRELGDEGTDYFVNFISHFDNMKKESSVLNRKFIQEAQFVFPDDSIETFKNLAQYKKKILNAKVGEDASKLKGLYAETKARLYFDGIGAKPIKALEGKTIYRNPTTKKLAIAETGDANYKKWDAVGEYDTVRISPYDSKEIWFTEVKYGDYQTNVPKLYKQLANLDEEVIEFLRKNKNINFPEEGIVRRIAWADKSIAIDEMDPIVFSQYGSTISKRNKLYLSASSASDDEVADNYISIFIIPNLDSDTVTDPDDSNDDDGVSGGENPTTPIVDNTITTEKLYIKIFNNFNVESCFYTAVDNGAWDRSVNIPASSSALIEYDLTLGSHFFYCRTTNPCTGAYYRSDIKYTNI